MFSEGLTVEDMMEKQNFYDQEQLLQHAQKAMRFNKGKLKWSYVHFKSLEPMVRVLMFGAQKYAPFNWQKGLNKDEILESMMRHVAAMIDGQIIDPESGLPHIGHIQCNAMFYQYMMDKEEGKLRAQDDGVIHDKD